MSLVQHMVLVRFKSGTTQSQITEMFSQLTELRRLIPGILYFAGGEYASPEGLNGEFTHGFLVTFESVAARDAYLPHPEHQRVKEAVLPHVESVVVFDFEAPSAPSS